jgi:16S rRNA (cytosine967-C5)-methyltransferase
MSVWGVTGLVVNLLDPTPGDFIVDACAAPGGKAFHAAERLKGEGKQAAKNGRQRLRMPFS